MRGENDRVHSRGASLNRTKIRMGRGGRRRADGNESHSGEVKRPVRWVGGRRFGLGVQAGVKVTAVQKRVGNCKRQDVRSHTGRPKPLGGTPWP